jgi:hypothetical protein
MFRNLFLEGGFAQKVSPKLSLDQLIDEKVSPKVSLDQSIDEKVYKKHRLDAISIAVGLIKICQ